MPGQKVNRVINRCHKPAFCLKNLFPAFGISYENFTLQIRYPFTKE